MATTVTKSTVCFWLRKIGITFGFEGEAARRYGQSMEGGAAELLSFQEDYALAGSEINGTHYIAAESMEGLG